MNILEILKSGNQVFLGGDCKSGYQKELIPEFDKLGIKYFNPVVENWDEDEVTKKIEDEAKDASEIMMYVFTSSGGSGYSYAEVVDSAWKSKIEGIPKKVIMVRCGDFSDPSLKHAVKALKATSELDKHASDNFHYIEVEKITDLVK